MIRIKRQHFLGAFCLVVLVLGVAKCANPALSQPRVSVPDANKEKKTEVAAAKDTEKQTAADRTAQAHVLTRRPLSFRDAAGNIVKHRVGSVYSYRACFPDSNDVQLAAAQKWGVSPVADREEAEHRKKELVFMGSSPYYHVDPMYSSIPYLVPRASNLLHKISRSFLDSLAIKQIPLHTVIVTSVLRTEADVDKLRKRNRNASAQSCHRYGTTFDICYNRYRTVSDPDSAPRRAVNNDTLKWVLSEVLRDVREEGLCYVKYEVKQGCFHITVR